MLDIEKVTLADFQSRPGDNYFMLDDDFNFHRILKIEISTKEVVIHAVQWLSLKPVEEGQVVRWQLPNIDRFLFRIL